MEEARTGSKMYRKKEAGLKITAGQRTMSEPIWELTGQPFMLPVLLTRHLIVLKMK